MRADLNEIVAGTIGEESLTDGAQEAWMSLALRSPTYLESSSTVTTLISGTRRKWL